MTFAYLCSVTFLKRFLSQVLCSTIEIEQRIWLRRKWIKQTALINHCGILRISSASSYEKLEYSLDGANAVLLDDNILQDGAGHQPIFQIQLDPNQQIDNVTSLTFRLLSSEDIRQWVAALSRCELLLFGCCNKDHSRSVTHSEEVAGSTRAKHHICQQAIKTSI